MTDETRAPPGSGRPQLPTGPASQIGPYVIERELARGGMGVVYVARHPQLGRAVAIKLMLAAGNPDRFRIEAEAAARLGHPNIVAIHDAGQHQGQPFIVMDLIEGRPLSDRIQGEGRLEPRLAALLTRELAEALEFAHGRGILHRDMKPANVILTRRASRSGSGSGSGSEVADVQPLITDFGLARDLHEERERLTRTGQMLGTPAYMPPEQADGDLERIDARSDVYSLGATLYAMLTGKPPFDGATAINIIAKVLGKDPVPPRTLRPDLPRDLDTICRTCLEKEPERRYASAGALADDLGRFLRTEPIVAQPPSLGRRLGKAIRRRPLLSAATGLLCAVLPVAGAAWLWSQRKSEATTARKQAADRRAEREARRAQEVEDAFTAFEARRVRIADQEEALAVLAGQVDAVERDLSLDVKVLRRRLTALQGLLRLTRGERVAPPDEASRSVEIALRGSVAALDPQGDPRAAVRDLTQASERTGFLELRVWRAMALDRLGPPDRKGLLLARQDLDAAQPLSRTEEALRVRVLVGLRLYDAADGVLGALRPRSRRLERLVKNARRLELAIRRGLYGAVASRLKRLAPLRPPIPLRQGLAELALRNEGETQQRLLVGGQVSKRAVVKLVQAMEAARLLTPATYRPSSASRRAFRAYLDGRAHAHRMAPSILAGVGRLFPDDAVLQREVGLWFRAVPYASGRRALLPFLRRACALASRPAERLQLQQDLCALLASINDVPGAPVAPAQVREGLALVPKLLTHLGENDAAASELLMVRARMLRVQGDVAGALQAEEQALKRNKRPDYLAYHALTLWRAGRSAQALKLAEGTFAGISVKQFLEERGTMLCRRMASLVWEATRAKPDDPRALRMIERLLGVQATLPGWWVRAALLHLRGGDAVQAGRCLRRANKSLTAPALPTLSRHLLKLTGFKREPVWVALHRRTKTLPRELRDDPTSVLATLEKVVAGLEKKRGRGGVHP